MNILHTKVEVSYRLVDYDRYIDESQDKIKQHLMAISTDSDRKVDGMYLSLK